MRRLKRSGILIDRARGPDSKVSTGHIVYISQPLSEGFPSSTPFAWYPLDRRRFVVTDSRCAIYHRFFPHGLGAPGHRTGTPPSLLRTGYHLDFPLEAYNHRIMQTPAGHWHDPDWTLLPRRARG